MEFAFVFLLLLSREVIVAEQGKSCAFDLTPQIQLWPNQIPMRLTPQASRSGLVSFGK